MKNPYQHLMMPCPVSGCDDAAAELHYISHDASAEAVRVRHRDGCGREAVIPVEWWGHWTDDADFDHPPGPVTL